MPSVGRLAPTPSGRLHLGNVCAFAGAWLSARSQGGRIVLRIEDVDQPRARRDIEQSVRDDLAWLGLHWDLETPRQSARRYERWLAPLTGGLYHCDCTRAAIQAGGGVYRGACRERGLTSGTLRFRLPEGRITIVDRARGPVDIDVASLGDPVLRRRDGVYAYNLAVVADDLDDGVTEVVRGADLLEQSAVQVCLWRMLGRTPPTWLHTPLILGHDGRKLSKSHGSTAVAALRDAGWTPGDVWGVVLPWLGLERVTRIADAVDQFSAARVARGPFEYGDAPPRRSAAVPRTARAECNEFVPGARSGTPEPDKECS
jgi:glutamyl-Q tRNA(Asp) synthetase